MIDSRPSVFLQDDPSRVVCRQQASHWLPVKLDHRVHQWHQRAVLTETIADVVGELTSMGAVGVACSADSESILLALIDDQPVSYASLLKETGFSMRNLSSQLIELEIAGRIINSAEGYHRALI